MIEVRSVRGKAATEKSLNRGVQSTEIATASELKKQTKKLLKSRQKKTFDPLSQHKF